MVTVLEQDEELPDSYPVPSFPVRPAIPDQVWQRIESYIAWRFTERTVVWIVEGCGEFRVPLKPATMTTIEIWDDVAKAWDDITANAEVSPRGYWLPGRGPYRFTARSATMRIRPPRSSPPRGSLPPIWPLIPARQA